MWDKIKEQLPTVILTLVLIGGVAFWLHTRTVKQLSASQQDEIATLRAQTNAELIAANAETRAQIDAVNRLLTEAINQRSADLFLNDQEVDVANTQRVDELATAIAVKMQPFNEVPQTPEEAERQENAQIDRVSDRITENIEPLLANLSSDTVRTRATLQKISSEISDQLSVILTSELAKNQSLNNNYAESQAIARDSLGLSQELTALYLSSFENQGVIMRLLALPANLVRDATDLSVLSSQERKKMEVELVEKMKALEEKAPVPAE